MDDSVIGSSERGLNVPRPTARFILHVLNFLLIELNRSSSKWSDAVGAAADSVNL